MKFVPNAVSRTASRSMLKLQGSSPTILVVAGVVGLGASAVMAAKATRRLDPILDEHAKTRIAIEENYVQGREKQKVLLQVYMNTGWELSKLYGPTVIVATSSAVAVLGGHRILRTRQISTLAAYTSLGEQFNAYRKRVALTLGEDVEKGIYEGAHGEWTEDPDHKGEYKLTPKFDEDNTNHYLRPWFDSANPNWGPDPLVNYLFLKGVQSHMNNLLAIRGHVFLNDVMDALKMDRTPEGSVMGWLYRSVNGDRCVDFGFMTGIDPQTIDFREGRVNSVRLNFNIDDEPIWNQI